MSMLFLRVLTPCELVGRYQRFGQIRWLYFRSEVVDTNVSEKHIVSISGDEDGEVCFSETFVSTHESTRRHSPEERH
jgi:hypothetical protein